jgi:hypothetical protein
MRPYATSVCSLDMHTGDAVAEEEKQCECKARAAASEREARGGRQEEPSAGRQAHHAAVRGGGSRSWGRGGRERARRQRSLPVAWLRLVDCLPCSLQALQLLQVCCRPGRLGAVQATGVAAVAGLRRRRWWEEEAWQQRWWE